MNAISFSSLSAAVAYAKQNGGWIMRGKTLVLWLDSAHWTLSRILAEFPGAYEIGTHASNWEQTGGQ